MALEAAEQSRDKGRRDRCIKLFWCFPGFLSFPQVPLSQQAIPPQRRPVNGNLS